MYVYYMYDFMFNILKDSSRTLSANLFLKLDKNDNFYENDPK